MSTIAPTKRSTKNTGDIFLQFQLDDLNNAAVPMLQTQEAIILPAGRVSVIPNLPSAVLGLFNRRSNLIWLIDLPKILGLKPLDRHTHSYDVILLKVGQASLAVAVKSIQGVIRFKKEEIISPIGNVNSAFVPYLSGWILQERELILVLDPELIINSKAITN